MKIIEGEFECPVSRIFSNVSDEPVAAASFGQVYQGRTVDGDLVAIKVQRPNLLPSVLRDIYILRLGVCMFPFAKTRSYLSI
uniref:ABC1 atypical kinase-like domain-containing protein n=1 Tax=Arundo donax TaxID=35708 RepID=A0A0A9DNP8_ARUDO